MGIKNLVIRSEIPVEVGSFSEGWANQMLLGAHSVKVVVSKSNVEPEVEFSSIDDQLTTDVALRIVSVADTDYRSLGYVKPHTATVHHLHLRVGDMASNVTGRMVALNGLRGINDPNKTRPTQETIRLANATKRPFALRGRGITHQDGKPFESDSDSVMYTLTNQDGTISYGQRFLNPFNPLYKHGEVGNFFAVLLSAPILHLQAIPANMAKLEDNVVYRSYTNRDIHASAPHSPWLESQRVFIKDFVRKAD